MKCSRGRKRKAVILEPWYEEDDELREGYTVDHLLDKFIVTADYKYKSRPTATGMWRRALPRRVSGVWG